MAKSKKLLKKSDLKKDLRIQVSQSLEKLFKDFEAVVGKRKFRRNIRKASKILTADVKPAKIAQHAEKQQAAPNDQPFSPENENGHDDFSTGKSIYESVM